jgi:hypothetical protein
MHPDNMATRLFIMASILFLVGAAFASPNSGPAGTGRLASSSDRSPGHPHLRGLIENAFRYLDPVHGILDPHSGYPAEGWNQEPDKGLFLRSFTQLTAIGAWIEVLANVAAGTADNPYISKDAALQGLARAVATLLADQRNPDLAAKGLLVNFLGLDGTERRGPLLESIERRRFIDSFGDREGSAIWQALLEKGWLQEEDSGRKGRIRRGMDYGALHFDGPLTPYADGPRRADVMALLDQRVVTIIFGDNANLTAALARSIGALLRPEIREDPRAVALRKKMERFIAAQHDGYAHLFDPQSGTFMFGWDATADRFVGWDDGRGNWITGQMNYFVNEFRGPLTFVVLRYDLPVAAIRNAGFKIKPYRGSDGYDDYALAAWDGSAFQLLGLSAFMQETRNPAWRKSLETLVDIQLDYARRHGLPGLLSEAYSGKGTEYTGLIGIPEMAVTDHALNIHAPSLYSLGVAYSIAPEPVEDFLREHWPYISRLFTDHGPWEGWDMSRSSDDARIIPYQTTVHTLSLILGGIDTAQDNMYRYLDASDLGARLEALYRPGDRLDLLASENRIIPWTANGETIDFSCLDDLCRFAAHLGGSGGLAFVIPGEDTVSLSNGILSIRYRSETELAAARIAFGRSGTDPLSPSAIPIEIVARFAKTQDGRIEVVLPATPALSGIKEIALIFESRERETPVDIAILGFDFVPFDVALRPTESWIDGGRPDLGAQTK